MAERPYWNGQIRVALVYLPVNIFSAIRKSAQMPLHQIHRQTGERIHYLKVNEEGDPVENEDIVKGYKLDRENYVLLENEELDQVKLPSSDTLELVEFADAAAIPITHFERPFVILPDGKEAEEIYGVLREAMRESGKTGIGQLTLRGREELCAVMPYDKGLIMETLRYDSEIEDLKKPFGQLGEQKLKSEYIEMARQLIKQNSHPLELEKFHDHYHAALRELIEAKKAHRAPRFYEERSKPAKVVNFMDALERSLKTEKKSPGKTNAGRTKSSVARRSGAHRKSA